MCNAEAASWFAGVVGKFASFVADLTGNSTPAVGYANSSPTRREGDRQLNLAVLCPSTDASLSTDSYGDQS
jgi:hypothetical protein